MIQQIWDKKIITEIYLNDNDVADDTIPLPLILQLSWNHYLAFYFNQIVTFFSSYILHPWKKQEFHLTLQNQNIIINGTQIVGHLVTMYNQGIKNPIKFTCNFRNKSLLPTIQIQKYFKYSLKASTAIRNSKLGASILTLHMSIKNVQKMYQSFIKNNLKQYLGTNDFENKNLGYSFIVSKTQRIPLKIVGDQFIIERSVQKETSLGRILSNIFSDIKQQHQSQLINIDSQIISHSEAINIQDDKKTIQQKDNRPNSVQVTDKQNSKQNNLKYNQIFSKYNFYMHGVKIARGQYPLSFFQRFSHPDGFLYIFFKELS